MQDHLVIIGGVAAGTKAAAKARRESPDLKISLYTEGKFISYSACGMPYYIEDLIKDYRKLLVRSVEDFKAEENIDIYTEHKVTKILPDKKKIIVENVQNKSKFEVEYTKLLLATGAKPFVLNIEGVNLDNVFTLRHIEDGIAIKNAVAEANKAVIVGCGNIGVEMAQAFYNCGIDTTLIELANQILPYLDQEIASQVQKYLEEKGIKIIPNDGVKRIIRNQDNKATGIETNSGKILDADIVLLAIGVRPNVEIAKEAGVEIGETGGIKINERLETNIPDIYAAGDCVEEINIITGRPTLASLGSIANKQGRIAAINITGGQAEFKGILISTVTKVFDYTVAKTGISEKEAKLYGFDYETALVPHKDKSGYYPGAEKITIKLIADKKEQKITWGADYW